MNETIRKEQINWLSQSLKSGATFNATLNRSSKEGHAMSLIATHGQWYLTEEDLKRFSAPTAEASKVRLKVNTSTSGFRITRRRRSILSNLSLTGTDPSVSSTYL